MLTLHSYYSLSFPSNLITSILVCFVVDASLVRACITISLLTGVLIQSLSMSYWRTPVLHEPAWRDDHLGVTGRCSSTIFKGTAVGERNGLVPVLSDIVSIQCSTAHGLWISHLKVNLDWIPFLGSTGVRGINISGFLQLTWSVLAY